MEVTRLDNLDLRLEIDENEFSRLKKARENKELISFIAKIQSHQGVDPWKGREVKLILSDDRDSSDGLDGEDILKSSIDPISPLPIYIGRSGINRLFNNEMCLGYYLPCKIELRVKKLNIVRSIKNLYFMLIF